MRTIPNKLIHLFDEHELAEMLGVSVATIRRWRLLGRGPGYLKLGALVRYAPESVEAWLNSRPKGGEGAEAE